MSLHTVFGQAFVFLLPFAAATSSWRPTFPLARSGIALGQAAPREESLMKSWKANASGVPSRRFLGVLVVRLGLTTVPAKAGDSTLEGEEIASHVRRFRSRDAFAVARRSKAPTGG